MKKFRILLIAILAICISVSLFACNSSKSNKSKSSTSKSVSVSEENSSEDSSETQSSEEEFQSSSLGTSSISSVEVSSSLTNSSNSSPTMSSSESVITSTESVVNSSTPSSTSSSKEEPIVYYSVLMVGSNIYGEVEADKESVASGNSVTLTITPNAHCYLEYLKINGQSVTVTGTTYVINNVTEDISVDFNFVQETYNVVVNQGANGTVSPNVTNGPVDTAVTLTITPNEHYELKELKINGKAVTVTGNSYTFDLVEDTTVDCSFKQKEYTVSVSSSANGTVTPSVTKGIVGTSVTLTITPNANYALDYLKVNNQNVTVSGNKYTFTIQGNTSVEYAFKLNAYSISVTSATGATVTPSVQMAAPGTSVTLNIALTSGYAIDWVKVNGTAQTVTNNKVTFTMPTGDAQITYACVRVYNITKNTPANGTVSLSATSAKAGTEITITATPASSYVTSTISITYSGTTTNLDIASNQASFTMPSADVSVSVEFAKVDNREYVSHLIFGDSYTHHQHFFRNFYADMQDLPQPKILGIGGTQIPQWGKTGTTTFQNIHLNSAFNGQGGLDGYVDQFNVTRTINIKDKYNVQNFVFHIGINDINGGTSASAVINDLKILFSQYHEAYPDANIYWISLSLISCRPDNISKVKEVNSAIKTYASQTSYLTYINTVDTMFPNGEPIGDWFNGGDGLHYNVDGYNTWSSLILAGLGYPRKDIGTEFGNAGAYYSSNTWTENNGIVTNSFDIPVNNTDISLEGDGVTTVSPFSEQNLWFKDSLSVDSYAEMDVSVNSVAFNDQFPKFGMALKGEGTHMFFFVDALAGLNGTATSFTERKMKQTTGGFLSSFDWDWSIQKWGKAITGSYTNGNYIKLGLLRTGTEMYFLVNDVIVLDLSGREYTSGDMAIGFTTFALEVSIKNYSVTTNIASKLSALGIKNGGTAYYVGQKDTLDITTGGEVAHLLENVNASKFYFEATFKPNSVINSDMYPKFGIVLKASNGDNVLFYVDAVAARFDATANANVFDASVFGTAKNVGFVHRSTTGTNWNWNSLNLTYVPSMSYGNGGTIKMGIYKDGAKIVGLINGVAVVSTTRFTDFAGAVQVGYMGFNINADITDTKLATSTTLLNVINQNYGLKNDLTIDANLSDWSATQKASPYGATSTDGSGRKFTVYAFMGTNGIYVGYEMIHQNLVTDNIEWFTSTNFEMFAGNGGIQCFASTNGQSLNVVDHAIKSVKNGNLYTTTCELILSYGSAGYTGTESSVSVGFACKTGGESVAGMTEGNTGDWWCGPKHAVNNRSTVARAGGIS